MREDNILIFMSSTVEETLNYLFPFHQGGVHTIKNPKVM